MYKSFKQYTEEKRRRVIITFGRFNPPTIGHEKLFQMIEKNAKGQDFRIFSSQSVDQKKDPLTYDQKIKYMRAMFPKYGRSIIHDRSIVTILEAASAVYKEGFTEVVIVAGGDRIPNYRTLIPKYNGVRSKHGFYDFTDISFINAGDRNPDDEGVAGMSASKMRAAAADDDYTTFSKGLPRGFRNGRELFNDLRIGMGLKETREIHTSVLENPDEVRESYLNGDIGCIGDMIVIDDEIYTISERHTNYVSAVSKYDRSVKKIFIKDLVEDYYKDLGDSTSDRRRAQFNKQAERPDDDPSAYKPAPGDARAETKPSKWTKAYQKKYGESVEEDAKTALQKKSEKTGISYDILKAVYDRGMAAWKTGHRPGANQQQWAYARVNSFIVGGPTQKTTDRDLWAKHTGKDLKEETWEDGFMRRVVVVTDDEKKSQGYNWRIKGKKDDSKTIKYYKNKPDYEEYKLQMKRVAGHEFGK